MSRPNGALALILHSHMPYVEGFGTWPFGEEWLWEALAGVYLPLLELVAGRPLTVGVTPVLCDQLEALRGEAGDRFVAFLRDVRAPIHAEDAQGLEAAGETELAAEVRRAARDYEWAEQAFEAVDRDLVEALARLDGVELWTSAATHAVLPLIATDPGLRLQLRTGIASHERRFGGFGGGFWLPECAYEPGLERTLGEHGVEAFCVDQTERHGLGAPEQLRPVLTEAGPVVLPIDWQAVELVWQERSGYPASDGYRDYHRRTVHDLRPWNNAGAAYRRDEALALAREHAADFLDRARERLSDGGLLCCALDTELLGHWWYEGQAWLGAVLDGAEAAGVELVTVSDGLERVPPEPAGPLGPSSWGTGRDLSTWDSPAVAEIAFSARRAELETVRAAALRHEPQEALERAARELLALQSSDWAFQVTRDLAAEYPRGRVDDHLAAHAAAVAALTDSAAVPDPALRHLAPDLDLAPLVAP